MGGIVSKTSLAFVAALILVCIAQVPLSPKYLALDNVNFAFALEEFNPWMHQPHPPGYPFFVGESRLVNFLLGNARTTFVVVSAFVSALCLLMAASVGTRMFSPWAGFAAALLLLVNPTFWYSSLESPLRPHLTFFSLLVGYCCWRSWIERENRFVIWGAIALGVGSGFRPDLIFYFFPLWVVAAYCGGAPWNALVRGVGIIFGMVVLTVAILGWAVGGLDRLNLLLITYLGGHFGDTSVLFGSTIDWLFQFCRLIAWNGVGVASWIFAVPLWIYGRQRQSNSLQRLAFITAWIGPGLAWQAMFHAAAPGHTLFSVPVLCLIGGNVLSISFQKVPSLLKFQPAARGIALFLALAINIVLFLNSSDIAVRMTQMETGRLRTAQLGFADGIFQASPGNLRQVDEFTGASIEEIRRLVNSDYCAVIVASLGSSQHFRFLNSRIASYYFPNQSIWIVADEESAPKVTLIQGKDVQDIRYGPSIDISIPKKSRLIWLTEATSPLRIALGSRATETQTPSVFYTDFAATASPLQVSSVRFKPDQPACRRTFAERLP